MVVNLTDQNFKEEVLKSKTLILVDFYTDWCPPCKMMAPVIEKIAEDFKDKIKIGKLNTDQNFSTASLYRIEAIPTLIFFKDGQIIDKIIGMVSYKVLEEKIKEHG